MEDGQQSKMTVKNLFNSSLLRSSGIYTASSLINAALPLILMPYLTKVLSVEDYGIVAIFMLLQAFFGPFVSMNVHAAISRKFFSDDVDFSFQSYLFNGLLLILVSTVATLLVMLCFSIALTRLTHLTTGWLVAAVISAAGQFVVTSILTVLQVKGKPMIYGAMQICLTVVNLIFTFFLIKKYNYSYSGRILAIVYSYAFCAVVYTAWLFYRKQIKIKVEVNQLKHLLFYGAPLIPHVLGGIMLGMADRLLINKLHSTYQAGIFTVALQLCSILTVILSSFNAAFIPWLFKKLKENNFEQKKQIVRFTYAGFVVIAVVGFFYALLLPNIIHLITGNKYDESVKNIIWILIGIVFNGFYILIANYIFFAEKTYLLAISTFSCALIYWPIALCMFKLNGVIGIPQASAISFCILFFSTWLLSGKVYKMPWLLK